MSLRRLCDLKSRAPKRRSTKPPLRTLKDLGLALWTKIEQCSSAVPIELVTVVWVGGYDCHDAVSTYPDHYCRRSSNCARRLTDRSWSESVCADRWCGDQLCGAVGPARNRAGAGARPGSWRN